NPYVAADGPTRLRQPLRERSHSGRRLRIVCGHVHQHTDAPYLFGLLRAHRQRPHRCRAKQRDELAAVHSITSSAIASTPGGIVRPRTFAVLRLITNSNLADWITGRSAGFSPFKIRPAYMPTCRYASGTLAP